MPWARRKPKHIAPPIKIESASSRKRSIAPILSLTFAPPSTDTNGRAGFRRSALKARTSRSSKSPATAGSWRATPSVVACAR
jgi:hypothetical protein